MSTYEFHVNAGSHTYQSDASELTLQGPTQALTPGPTNTPQPIIIQYDGSNQKHLYGSGDQVEDGFNLQFPTLDDFMDWKHQEEENNCVDFFKVDCHTSKAVPPRFKEHVKFACSRHVRAGQKKYVKKYPERQRKTPSKKIEGVGCPSAISYKTYFDTSIVKVNYNSNHSHDTGEANRPFTKRFRRENRNNRHKSTVTTSPGRTLHHDHSFASDDQNNYQTGDDGPSLPPSPPASMHDTLDMQHVDQSQYSMHPLNYEHAITSQHTSPSAPNNQHLHPQHPHHHSLHHPQPIQHHAHPPASQHSQHGPHAQQQQQPTPIQDLHRMQINQPNDQVRNFDRARQHSVASLSTPNHDVGPPSVVHQMAHYQHRTDQERAHMHPHMSQQPQRVAHPPHLAVPGPQPQQAPHHMPLLGPQTQQASQSPLPPPPPPPVLPDRRQLTQERWVRLANMFGHIKKQAETFEFNDASVSALEMLLVRLYLETPSTAQDPSR